MSHPGLNPPRRADGATAVTDAPRRRRWPLALLIALLALLALLLLSRCGNDEDTKATPGTTPSADASADASATSLTSAPTNPATAAVTDPAATTSPTASASAPESTTGGSATGAGEADGTITTGSTVILGNGVVKDMNANTGQQAQGRSVPVQSVPADEGFWVGTSATDRVWVQLTGNAGESPYQVKQGDLVDFNGTITPAGKSFADQVGLSAAEGADQLTEQKQYVLVNKADVKLSK